MDIDIILQYVKPELLIVAVALYFIGVALKKTKLLEDRFIPIVLGAIGIVLALVWVLATSNLETAQNVLLAIFTAVVQGVLVAGLSTYINQIIKQAKKGHEAQENERE